MGEAIRDDLEESLDAALLDSRTVGTPKRRSIGFRSFEKRASGREARTRNSTGSSSNRGGGCTTTSSTSASFESVDENAVRFSAEQIRNTGHGLVEANPPASEIEEIGFDEGERLSLIADLLNNDRSSRWVPTKEIPADVSSTWTSSAAPPAGRRRHAVVDTDARRPPVAESGAHHRRDTRRRLLGREGNAGGLYLLTVGRTRSFPRRERTHTDGQLMAGTDVQPS